MLSEFGTLCQKLGIQEKNPSSDNYNRLKEWCLQHISQENYERSYSDYVELARHYVDVFLPNIPNILSEPVSNFNQLNAIQYAASMGYDRFLQDNVISLKNLQNIKTRTGMTALHFAALYAHPPVVELLLAQGASARELNNKNQFPIKCLLTTPASIDADYKSRKIKIYHLLESNAPEAVKGIDSAGETVAHAMASGGYVKLMDTLLEKEPSLVFISNNSHHYPIHTAILNGQTDIVERLMPLEGMAVLDDRDGRVALHYAVESGSTETIKICCKYSSLIDIRDSYNKTPLMYAIEKNDLPAITILTEYGADINLSAHQNTAKI